MKSAAIRFCAVASVVLMMASAVSRAQEAILASPKPLEIEETIVFEADEISYVLRLLARKAGVNIVIFPQVKGTVTVKLEKTPMEAIEIIAESSELSMDEIDNVLYVMTKEEFPKSGRLLKKITVSRKAKSKKLYFEELLKVGFNRDEALQIVAHEKESPNGTPSPK